MHTSAADRTPALFRGGDIGVSSEWRDLTYDWWPLLTADGVFIYSYLRDSFDKQRALRPFLLTPEGPPKQRLQRVLQRRTEYGVQGPEYLLETVGLLAIDVQRGPSPDPTRPQHTTVTSYVVGALEHAVLDWSMVERVLDALLVGLAPSTDGRGGPRQRRAQAALRSLGLGGMLQNEDPEYLFEPDGAWPMLLPQLIQDERWTQLFTQLHGVDALTTYRRQARRWVELTHRRAERLMQENDRIREHLLAAQRRPAWAGQAGSTPSEPQAAIPEGLRVPDARRLTQGACVPAAVPALVGTSPQAGPATEAATGTAATIAPQLARSGSAAGVPDESQAADQILDHWRSETRYSLSVGTNSIGTVPQAGHSSTVPLLADAAPLVAEHLREAELTTTRLDGYFWVAVREILQDDSGARYLYTAGERKAVQRLLTRQHVSVGVILAALRAVISLPQLARPQLLGDLLKLDLFHRCLVQAAALVARPSVSAAPDASWPAFMDLYRSVGLRDRLRNVSPIEWPLIADLFARQPTACWEVLRRVELMSTPPPLSFEYLKRAVINNQRALITAALQPAERSAVCDRPQAPAQVMTATPEPGPDAATSDPRRALLVREGIHPGILTPAMTIDLIQAWIDEADARDTTIERRAGWLAWGIRKERFPQDVAELGLRPSAGNALPGTGGRPAPGSGSSQPDESSSPALWRTVLDQLRQAMPTAEFDVWIKDAALIAIDDDRAIVGVANVFVQERLEACYLDRLRHSLHTALGYPVGVQVVIGGA